MGLDVYLYRYDNFEDTRKREKEYNEFSNKNWEQFGETKYDDIPEEDKERVNAENKAKAIALGLDEWGDDKLNKQKIELDSSIDPEHYFKLGYFRSSYNGSGINHILANHNIGDLYWIFNRERDDDYQFQPDWVNALERVKIAIEQLKTKPDVRVKTVSWSPFKGTPQSYKGVGSEEDAMKVFMKEFKKKEKHDYDYENSEGIFYFTKPLKVLGIIEGAEKVLLTDIKMPTTYIIYEGESGDWYVKALQIVQQTIEYVLAKEDKEKYYLHWSS